MPKELPGFYYDGERNRYFPIKGPIPGSSHKRKSSASASSAPSSSAENSQKQDNKRQSSMNKRTDKLLQFRELNGNVIPSGKGKLNFQTEYVKRLASKPLIWKYQNTQRITENGLEQIRMTINMSTGAVETDFVVTGGASGTMCLLEARNVGGRLYERVDCVPNRAWPLETGQVAESVELPHSLWRLLGASATMDSDISCITKAATGNVLLTTLGSGTCGGTVYLLNASKPLLYGLSSFGVATSIHQIIWFESTIWSAACNFDGSQVVIGTNRGATLVDIETRNASQIFRSKSDVLSVQAFDTGHIICGLRNGGIVTVDARQRAREICSGIPRHFQVFSDKLKKNIYSSHQISMPSSVSSLVSLRLYDQYFLASSMDGSIKLYDHRLLQRGAIQSYEGLVNSHTRIQLGVDPAERIVMSGGEDYKLRLWSIKSGELLFENKFMNSIPSVVCWPKSEGSSYEDYWENNSSGAWLGSKEGLFYMNLP